jgi:hypothetical protein
MTTNKDARPNLYIPGSFIRVCSAQHETRMQMESLDCFRGAQEHYDIFTITDLKNSSHEGCPWRCERETASDYFYKVTMLTVSEEVNEVARYVGNIPQMCWSYEIDRYHLAAATSTAWIIFSRGKSGQHSCCATCACGVKSVAGWFRNS